MEIDWKKIGLIALFVTAVALFIFFLYFFFFRIFFAPPPSEPTNTNQLTNGTLPTTVNINGQLITLTANGGLPSGLNINTGTELILSTPEIQETKTTLLTDKQAKFSTILDDGSVVFYDPTDGKFYRLSATGQLTEYDSKVFYNVQNVNWSNGRDTAILEYPDGSNIFYDFENNKQITLPNHWEDFDFSPTDQQIAFKSIGLDVENRFLAIARVDGSGSKTLERIGGVENQFDVNWSPNNQMVATFYEYRDADRSNIYFVGQNNENFKLMITEGRGFVGEWSPEGNHMLYSVYSSNSEYKPELWITNSSANTIGDNRHSIDLQTWADKCSFASTEIVYCAVPKSLPFGIGLDRDEANSIADNIYRINLETGVKQLVATPAGNHNINQIIITNNLNQLYFTDSNTNEIYQIEL